MCFYVKDLNIIYNNINKMSTFIKKETVNRLIKDIKQIRMNPLTENGIYYIHDDADMMKGYALIVGPEDTPYFGGLYFFELTYPNDYPHTPPKVKFCTNNHGIRFNPNLYTCGKVCVSLLNTWRGDQWTSCQTISTVLLTLCTLFSKNPLLNEPGVNIRHSDMNNYNNIIEFANIDIAVCDIVEKTKGVFLPFFDLFFSFVLENTRKNIDKFIAFIENKKNDCNNEKICYKTCFYNMNVVIDYNKELERLHKLKSLL
jgi:ubiquitin-conjugating enzyme E2 Z